MSETEKKTTTEMERKLKKEEKAREKEMKKAKALEKAKLHAVKSKSTEEKIMKKKKMGKEEEDLADFIDPRTSLGEKKNLSSQMPKQYNPSTVEKS